MLVLSRKVGSRIAIGGSIEVIVVRVRGNRVFLGVTAHDGVSVARLEEDVPEGHYSGSRFGGFEDGGLFFEHGAES